MSAIRLQAASHWLDCLLTLALQEVRSYNRNIAACVYHDVAWLTIEHSRNNETFTALVNPVLKTTVGALRNVAEFCPANPTTAFPKG